MRPLDLRRKKQTPILHHQICQQQHRNKGNYIKLPKVGWVKFAKSRKVEGDSLRYDRRNPSGKYFVSTLYRNGYPRHFPKPIKSVGIDLGLKYFAVLSNGEEPIKNPKWFRTLEEKLIQSTANLIKTSSG